MRTAKVKDHASFHPAADFLRTREAEVPTPPGDPVALAALAKAKAALHVPQRQDMTPLVAQAWGVTPRAVRRNVLNLAGLDPDRWESPIHSFTDSERIAIRAAAHRAMRARHRQSGTYYFLDTGERPRREIALGRDYHLAVMKWAELSITKHGSTNTVTFRYVAERYVKEVLPTKARRTQQDNLKELNWLYQFFDEPDALLDDIEPVNIRQYLDWRKAKVRANREKALFSHIWNYARGKGLTNKTNPCAGIKGNAETGRSIYVEDSVYKAVWDAANDPLRDAIELAYLTGQRPADVRKLSRADIKDGALWIQQNKTNKRLRIAIEGQLATTIDRINARKVVGVNLICTATGQPFTYAMLRGAFDRARLAAAKNHPILADQIKAYQFRDLRAKAGTDTEEIAGIDAAQSQLGHTTPTMTSHYVRHRKGKLVKPTK